MDNYIYNLNRKKFKKKFAYTKKRKKLNTLRKYYIV